MELGHLWRPITVFDTGVDGEIELRNKETSEVLGTYIKVQVKAGDSYFKAETNDDFTFILDKDDYDYWMKGNVPVILVVCRPENSEAYWVSLRQYIKTFPQVYKDFKIRFAKKQMQFNAKSSQDLLDQSVSPDRGIYFSPQRKNELLQSNLIKISSYPKKIWFARTEYRAKEDIWAFLKSHQFEISGEWMLKDKCIYSFHNLESSALNGVCESGTFDSIATKEWSLTEDKVKQKDFVWLLRLSFKELCYRRRFRFNKKYDCYFFWPSKSMISKNTAFKVKYQGFQKRSHCMFFNCYGSKQDQHIIFYYRHLAFRAEVRCFDNDWFVAINPTYIFTYNGNQLSKRIDEYLSNIKRREYNSNVVRYVRALGQFLQRQQKGNMFEKPELIKIEPMEPFEFQYGIDDKRWYHSEDEKPLLIDPEDEEQLRLGL